MDNRSNDNSSRYIIIAAVITGVFAVIVALIGIIPDVFDRDDATQPVVNPIVETTTTTPVPTTMQISEIDCSQEPTIIDQSSSNIIPEWQNPIAEELWVRLPECYSYLYISSDAGIFNDIGVFESPGAIIISESDVLVDGVTFNDDNGHYNISAIAFSNISDYRFIIANEGFGGKPFALILDSNGLEVQRVECSEFDDCS